jgi:serine-type D-Ala-D-Ala carboxypeptidase/endopeptidase (penicillin-binding protein 4)
MRHPRTTVISCFTALVLLASCQALDDGRTKRRHLGAGKGDIAAPGPKKAPRGPNRPRWKRKIDHLVPDGAMSIHARYSGTTLYSHDAQNRRPPASNEKLLLTMALFDGVGPDYRIPTDAAVRKVSKGVVLGDLWIRGHGDPGLTKGGGHSSVLRFRATRIDRLVGQLKRAGITRIEGNVMASTGYFARDWNAPGWKSYFNDIEVALPSALALNGNVHKGKFTARPEYVLAGVLHKRLRRAGIEVTGSAGAGPPPGNLKTVATVRSVPLEVLARFMNRTSSNFFAETLGKLLDAHVGHHPGDIGGAAQRLRVWARHAGVRAKTFDSSGLSYDNRISARGLVNLLEAAKDRAWVGTMRSGLAAGGQGTLRERFPHLRIRAKTGTLRNISTLSGWVWLYRARGWAEFSIMSRGLEKSRAVKLENKIVRLLAHHAP